jgi:hypothetical protein
MPPKKKIRKKVAGLKKTSDLKKARLKKLKRPIPQKPPTNSMAVAALIVGIVALLSAGLALLLIWYPAVGLGVIGIVLGIIGLVKSKQTDSGTVMSIIGMVLCVVAIVSSIIIWQQAEQDLHEWIQSEYEDVKNLDDSQGDPFAP